MIYFELFLGFLKVGLFSFGGAYAAIPLIREVVLSYGWLTDEQISYMIAVGESTPGPIMVNLATYVGSSQGGILGAVLATLASVLPAFVIILLVMVLLRHLLDKPLFQAVLNALKACVVGLILSVGVFLLAELLFGIGGALFFDWRALLCAALLAVFFYLPVAFPKLPYKKPSPILLIAVSALLGILIFR